MAAAKAQVTKMAGKIQNVPLRENGWPGRRHGCRAASNRLATPEYVGLACSHQATNTTIFDARRRAAALMRDAGGTQISRARALQNE